MAKNFDVYRGDTPQDDNISFNTDHYTKDELKKLLEEYVISLSPDLEVEIPTYDELVSMINIVNELSKKVSEQEPKVGDFILA